MSRYYVLILGILSVWRVTHLFQAEDGPWDIFVHIRRFAGNRFWGKLLDCFYCLSLWVSAPAAYFLQTDWKERILLWLSFSAGAILLERMTTRSGESDPGTHEPIRVYYQDEINPEKLNMNTPIEANSQIEK